MLTCCEVISAPLRLSIANIQFFVVRMHDSYHDLYGALKHIKHHQKRSEMASEESSSKAEYDLQVSIDALKQVYQGIQDSYSDPYMEKVRVHYPELHSALLLLRVKIQNDKTITALLSKEP